MRYNRIPLIFGALTIGPALLGAQPQRPRAPQTPPPPAGRPWVNPSATELLNRRRELELTPRQVTRLDSIERAQFARGRAFTEQLRRLRDSSCGPGTPCTDEQRRTLRDRVMALRAQQVDTNARRMAMALLDSTQRGRVQGWQMARGRQRVAMARGGMGRDIGRLRRSGLQEPGWRGMDGPRGGVRRPAWRGPAGGGWDDGRWMGRRRPGAPPEVNAPLVPRRPRRPGDEVPMPDSSRSEGVRP